MNCLIGWIEAISEYARAVLAVAVSTIVAGGIALAIREGNRPKSLDEPAFIDLGQNLAFHRRFAHTNSPDIEGYDPTLAFGSLRPTAYRAPAYAFLVAPFRRLGADYVGLRIVNVVVFAVTLCLLYALLVKRGMRLAGLLGVGLVLAYPVLFYAAGTLYPQTLAASLLLASVYLLDRLESTSTLRAYALAGLAFGALVLTVPVFLALAPIVVGWLIWTRRACRKRIASAVLAIGAVVGAWSARNVAVFHAPVVLGTSLGFNLLAGNSPGTRYDSGSAEVRWPKGVRSAVVGKNEIERDRIMTRAALLAVREDPGRAAVLYVQKFLYWFSFRNDLVSDQLVPGGAAAGPRWLRDRIMLFSYGLLLGILLFRLLRLARHPLSGLEALLIALYLGGGLAYAVCFTRIRFRLPFDWLLIALDALFLARLISPSAVHEQRKGRV
jgi:Dolichyl-phosphate-mannose-protein mannosyltransferase